MNFKWNVFSLLLIINFSFINAQEKVDYPYHLIEYTSKNNVNKEGIILEVKDNSFISIPKSAWFKMRGDSLNSPNVMSIINRHKYEFAFQNLQQIKVQKIEKRFKPAPWIGMAIGMGAGLAVAGLEYQVSCVDAEEESHCDRGPYTLVTVPVGGVIGYLIGHRLSLRKSKKAMFENISNEDWHQVLMEYSIKK